MSRFDSASRPANVASLVFRSALAAAMAAALSGCGTMTTAPLSSALGATDAAPGSARLSTGNTPAASTPTKLPVDPGEGGSGDTTVTASGTQSSDEVATAVLTGFTAGRGSGKSVLSKAGDVSSAGGSLTLGRWTLTVPVNAVPVGTRFTLSVAGSRGAACQVQVTPANAVITAPLTLTVDCRGVATSRTASLVMLVYGEATAQWTPVAGGDTDNKKHTISASIAGAGIYGVGYADGRAGW